MVPASLFCVGDVPQILRVNRRRKPTSHRKCVTEKTQDEKDRQERKFRRKKIVKREIAGRKIVMRENAEEKCCQERKRRRKKIVRRGEKREKGAVRQKACGWVNEQSSAGGKGAKRL